MRLFQFVGGYGTLTFDGPTNGGGMLGHLRDSLFRFGLLLAAAFRPTPGRRIPSPRRVLAMLLFLPPFFAVQFVHWVGFLLDEVFFRSYRNIEIRDPVFILGPPRSGTTFLHRVLARDSQFTTFALWESLLAPSIAERKAIFAVAAVDRVLGRPLGRIVNAVERRFFAGLADVHPTGLAEPEEDYLVLMPAAACFILVLLFPNVETLWKIGAADRELSERQRTKLMACYKACLQKHLYVHGTDRRLLSKNAAMSGMAASLKAAFPGARFICCLRAPSAVVGSQLSSIASAIRLFDSDPDGAIFTPRIMDLLAFQYENLFREFSPLQAGRNFFVRSAQSRTDLAATVGKAYDRLELPMSESFAAVLDAEQANARGYKSRHNYRLADFGLDEATVRKRFAAIYRDAEFAVVDSTRVEWHAPAPVGTEALEGEPHC